MAVKHATLFACWTIISLTTKANFVPHQQGGDSPAIFFQSYHWLSANCEKPNWYKTVQNKVNDLAKLGVTHVWFPPPSNAASPEGYLPRQLNNLDSCYGSKEELKQLCKAFKKKKIQCVVDIVINHRCGTKDWADFTEPEWSDKSVCKTDEWKKDGQPLGKGNDDTGEDFDGGRDLDHTNVEEVQNGIKKWMNETLKQVGFSGLRFDFVKGFHPKYVGEYTEAYKPDFCVGELWADLNLDDCDAGRQKIIDWVDGTGKKCGAFDFTTKGILNDALANANYWRLKDSQGKPAGMIGWWPAMSITFVDNHDTGPSEGCGSGQNHWPVPCDNVMEAYAYILTHPGIPSIYYTHVFNWNMKDQIYCLTKARKAAGITSTSPVDIQKAEQGLYSAIISGKSKKLAMKIGGADWSPSGGKMVCSGKNYAVWEI